MLKDGQVTLQTWNSFLTIFPSVTECKFNQANGTPIEDVAEIDQFLCDEEILDDESEDEDGQPKYKNAYIAQEDNGPMNGINTTYYRGWTFPKVSRSPFPYSFLIYLIPLFK